MLRPAKHLGCGLAHRNFFPPDGYLYNMIDLACVVKHFIPLIVHIALAVSLLVQMQSRIMRCLLTASRVKGGHLEIRTSRQAVAAPDGSTRHTYK